LCAQGYFRVRPTPRATTNGAAHAGIGPSASASSVPSTTTATEDDRDLRADTASIESFGAGTTTLWITTDLEVSITGVGGVRFYGEPEMSATITGVGTIEASGPK
jgi:hypothetical protein